ncbi:MAG: DUF1427 family protein [Oxalicibacterium faecigallinarum]|uniref:DUF1427 family protein n=1 Tax=Oxalicibacterium faecigallinarum TaxID=573741 RepID=A0A8J3AQ15_9BURK|nr:DUF1427 family protein [Oxalicibacterium faecigallinarum]MDQ7969533.1 DUF1427 family protein [Oxalicibacterium faecigallinarum]GGI17830.1 hypothetical protein GCM10008066_10950 [Oxalicibacterium faecigallinarum]
MKGSVYLLSLGAGLLVGILYALIKVRSPAPPAIALLGLLGMLIGEQLVPIAGKVMRGEPLSISWFASECVPRITGVEPVASTSEEPAKPSKS